MKPECRKYLYNLFEQYIDKVSNGVVSWVSCGLCGSEGFLSRGVSQLIKTRTTSFNYFFRKGSIVEMISALSSRPTTSNSIANANVFGCYAVF